VHQTMGTFLGGGPSGGGSAGPMQMGFPTHPATSMPAPLPAVAPVAAAPPPVPAPVVATVVSPEMENALAQVNDTNSFKAIAHVWQCCSCET
jgi:hypothetical protein